MPWKIMSALAVLVWKGAVVPSWHYYGRSRWLKDRRLFQVYGQ